MVLHNVTIDDEDVETINYQGDWGHGYPLGFPNITSTSSDDPGANFSVVTPPIFAFYFFGFQLDTAGLSQICIDCDPNNRVWVDIDTLNRSLTNYHTSVLLYSKQWKDAEIHDIIVANRADPRAGGEAILEVDKLVYTIDNGSDPSTTKKTSSAPFSTGSQTTISPFSTSSQTPTPSFSTSSQSATSPIAPQDKSTLSKSAIGAIVGGGVGGILLILAIIFLYRRRAQRVEKENPINPFTTDISTPTPPAHKELLAIELRQPEPMGNEEHRPAVIPTRTRAVVRREEDGGPVHGISESGGESAGTLPPDYDDLVERRQS